MKPPALPPLLLALALACMPATAPAQSSRMDNVQSSVSTRAAELPRDSVYQLPLRLTDAHGAAFDWGRHRGKPQLVSMFYSSCRYVCPLIVEAGKAVDRSLTPGQRERLGVEREVRLQQVHQPLVGLVERDRGAVLAAARLRLRDFHRSQAAASFA